MSTSRETARADDRLVTVISRWLARHVDDAELRRSIEAIGRDDLAPEQAEAVEELATGLSRPDASRGELEMIARETLEAVALG